MLRYAVLADFSESGRHTMSANTAIADFADIADFLEQTPGDNRDPNLQGTLAALRVAMKAHRLGGSDVEEGGGGRVEGGGCAGALEIGIG